MTYNDLLTYKANVQPALKGTYHNRTIYTTHAPSAGPVLIHLLNVLERYNLQEGQRDGLNTHRFVEALKCEYLGLKINPGATVEHSEFSADWSIAFLVLFP